jgi:hypothetical protein
MSKQTIEQLKALAIAHSLAPTIKPSSELLKQTAEEMEATDRYLVSIEVKLNSLGSNIEGLQREIAAAHMLNANIAGQNARLTEELETAQHLLRLANIDAKISQQLGRSIQRNTRFANKVQDALDYAKLALCDYPLSGNISAVVDKLTDALKFNDDPEQAP